MDEIRRTQQNSAEIEVVLDEALSGLLAGEQLDSVLARYPGMAEELRPALLAAYRLHTAPQPRLSSSSLASIMERAQAQAATDRKRKRLIIGQGPIAGDQRSESRYQKAEAREQSASHPITGTRDKLVTAPRTRSFIKKLRGWLGGGSPAYRAAATITFALLLIFSTLALIGVLANKDRWVTPEPTRTAFSLQGIIQSIDSNKWVVDNVDVYVDGETIIEGTPWVGASASIEGRLTADDRRLAEKITVASVAISTDTPQPTQIPTQPMESWQSTEQPPTRGAPTIFPTNTITSPPAATEMVQPSTVVQSAPNVSPTKQVANPGPSVTSAGLPPTAQGNTPIPTRPAPPIATSTPVPVATSTREASVPPANTTLPQPTPEATRTQQPTQIPTHQPEPTEVPEATSTSQAQPTIEPTETEHAPNPTNTAVIVPPVTETPAGVPTQTQPTNPTHTEEPEETHTPHPTAPPTFPPTTQPTTPPTTPPTSQPTFPPTSTAEPTEEPTHGGGPGPSETNTPMPTRTTQGPPGPNPSNTPQETHTPQPTQTRQGPNPTNTEEPDETHTPQPTHTQQEQETHTPQPTHTEQPEETHTPHG